MREGGQASDLDGDGAGLGLEQDRRKGIDGGMESARSRMPVKGALLFEPCYVVEEESLDR